MSTPMVSEAVEPKRAVSAIEPDWQREQPKRLWDPSRRLIKSIRGYQAWSRKKGIVARIVRLHALGWYRFWSVVTGAEIPITCKLGGGLLLPHPNGIVIYPLVEIGPNCLIMQQVTLGTRGRENGIPVVGGGVEIGAGAKILGQVRLGDYCRIGANAVVLSDVPEAATAVGIPARIIEK